MSEPFLGEIRMTGHNFAPRGWAFCAGGILPIAQNTALFSLLGTNFGGNGQTTFGLPDLRGRVPMFWGQGPGLSQRILGETAGTEAVTLIQNEMPAHVHPLQLQASTESADSKNPSNAIFAFTGSAATYTSPTTNPPDVTMAVQSTGIAGGSQPHTNIQPFQCVTFIIALVGIFPSRN